jgi:Chaperone of endosialidase
MGKKAPAAPDPYKTAAAQGGMNMDTAITQQLLNSGTQINPWGTVSTDQTGNSTFVDSQGKTITVPKFTQTTTLSPEQQAIFDQSQAAEGNLAGIANEQSQFLKDYLNKPFEFNNQDAEKWAFDLASPRIRQNQMQAEDTLRSTLANKGIREGSPAWIAEMTRMTNANTDQMNQLALTGRGQAFSEAMATRNQPLNEITALLSGSQVSNPATMSAPMPQAGVAGVDYTGLVNQKFQADTANYQNKMGGLFGMLSSGVGLFSDRRLKTDIRRVGATDDGVPIYTYRYVWGGPVHMGVMAQDVPDAAFVTDSGFLAVDYGEVR